MFQASVLAANKEPNKANAMKWAAAYGFLGVASGALGVTSGAVGD